MEPILTFANLLLLLIVAVVLVLGKRLLDGSRSGAEALEQTRRRSGVSNGPAQQQ